MKNSKETYGLIARLFHWIMALGIVVTFIIGKVVENLDYNSPFYLSGPRLHYSIGMLVLFTFVFRLAWKFSNVSPEPVSKKKWEITVVKVAHILFYILMFMVAFSGYMSIAADGHSIEIFGLFSIEPMFINEELAKKAHQGHDISVKVLLVLTIVHVLSAFKHHFVDKDRTLSRMWRG